MGHYVAILFVQILDFGFWILDFGFRILDFGFWILDFGFWILDFGFWILDFGFWILDFGFWISDFGFWILDFGVWILDLDFVPRFGPYIIRLEYWSRRPGSADLVTFISIIFTTTYSCFAKIKVP